MKFKQHLQQVQSYIAQGLIRSNLDGVWIFAGQATSYFLDDQCKPFKVNPYFNYIVPMPNAQGSWLFVDGVNKPHIYFYAPQDYWYYVETLPQADWAEEFDWTVITQQDEIKSAVKNTQSFAYLGEDENLAQTLGFTAINPPKLLNFLNYHRAVKTDYEIDCIQQAQYAALHGQKAAQESFLAGKSEFEINQAYLHASEQNQLDTPYPNIIATDRQAAVLHYERYQKKHTPAYSLLLDAGASYKGYASDITRTYAMDQHSEFAALIQAMDRYKSEIIAQLQVGYNYLTYHTIMQQNIAQLLADFALVKLSPQQIFDEGISRTFFPHGLGHLLGLQVHDVGGFLQNERGTRKPAPEVYPSLRCTRDLAEGMVLTIEPGFYFIDLLLLPWRTHPLSRYFAWDKIEQLKKYGGIRTEDNVVIRANGTENLTEKAIHRLNRQ